MIQYISVKQIMDDLLDDPLLQDLTLERVINYTQEFIRLIGMPQEFTEKNQELYLKDYKAKLPCDFESMIQVKDSNGHSYRSSTDSFHMGRHDQNITDLTYKLQNEFLYSNVKEGPIYISYRAIELDSNGYPLIIDNASFIKALQLYISKQHIRKLFRLGKVSQAVYQDAQQEYSWYVGQAQSDLIRPSLDEAESITNVWNNLINKNNEHFTQFKNAGSKEYIKVQ